MRTVVKKIWGFYNNLNLICSTIGMIIITFHLVAYYYGFYEQKNALLSADWIERKALILLLFSLE